jgi:hypothetical protein
VEEIGVLAGLVNVGVRERTNAPVANSSSAVSRTTIHRRIDAFGTKPGRVIALIGYAVRWK